MTQHREHQHPQAVPEDTPRSESQSPPLVTTAENDGVIVLGMHRAGTSPVANILVNFGFEVPGEVIPPGWDNPKGYWEPREIVEIHDEFLHSIDRTWSDPRPFVPEVFSGEAAARAREKLREAMDRLTSSQAQWMLKDPRMCRLTPLWEGVINSKSTRLRYLHVLRSPLSVARSLQERDGFSEEKGLLLWLRHYLEAEAATRGQDRAWLHFEKLTVAPAYVIERFLAVTGSLHFSVKRLQDTIGEVFVPSLVHHGLEFDAATEALESHRWVARAYQALDTLDTSAEAEGCAALDALRVEIDNADVLLVGGRGTLAAADDPGERYYWLRKEMERYQRLIEAQRREIETQRAEVDAMRDAFDAERQCLEGLHQEIAGQHRSDDARAEQQVTARRQSQEAIESMAARLDTVHQSIVAVAERQVTLRQGQEIAESLAEQQAAALRQGQEIVESLAEQQAAAQRQGQAALRQGQEIVESLAILDRQRPQIDAVRQSMETLAEGQVTARHQRREIAESLEALFDQSRKLDGVRQAVDSEREYLVSISERTSAIERLITERLEQRHLAVLQKSLEVTAVIESQWADTREKLVTMTAERDNVAVERDNVAVERDQVIERLLEELTEARRERNRTQNEVDLLLARKSWRLTAPLRWLYGAFRGAGSASGEPR